jgi:phage repressor protein C with HTH and peptisase S24 domain
MISLVERGNRGLRPDDIAKAAKELSTSTDYLLGLIDDPTPAASRKGNPAVPANGHSYLVPEEHSHSRATAETQPGHRLDAAFDQDGIWNLPIREVKPAAGIGAEVFGEEVVGYVPFRRDWLTRHGIDPAHADVVQVIGDSMEPTLPDGCSVLVDRIRRELQPKRIYVLRNEDGLVVKRADRNRDGWWVISDNPAWLPVVLTEDTDIVGEVRWAARTF